jgi:2'-5' RNA ligase
MSSGPSGLTERTVEEAETALVFCIPEADARISRWRDRYDPSAAEGVPAHVTVAVPFLPHKDFLEAQDRVSVTIGSMSAFDVVFLELHRFPGTLWLKPEPSEPIRKLSAQIVEAFPDYPLYGGAFRDIIPHLTVAQGNEELLDRLVPELSPVLETPIRSRITGCTVFVHDPGRWRAIEQFPLHIA